MCVLLGSAPAAAAVAEVPATAAQAIGAQAIGAQATGDGDRDAVAWLERGIAAAREVPHTGRLLVASFSREGPQLTEVQVTRGVDGGLTVAKADGWEVGRVGEEAFLRSSGTLLRLGGMERGSAIDLDRLAGKYTVQVLDEPVTLDTGPARVVRLREHGRERDREVVYLDLDTDLIVRRETFTVDGEPLRVVAYTDLEVVDAQVVAPDPEGLDVEAYALAPADLVALRRAGFVAPARLPDGYELVGGFERPEASVPTLHLVYDDGLYTLSVFEQQGRLSPRAVEEAPMLVGPDGVTVWRLPGSEPRRVIWRGNDRTFTAITDAPVDELLTVVAGLPNDPPPSMLRRLARGVGRMTSWLWPLERSET